MILGEFFIYNTRKLTNDGSLVLSVVLFVKKVVLVIFSEFCKIVSSQSMGYESQYRYLKQLFLSAKIKREYSKDYLKSIYNGKKRFSNNIKKHFPGNLDLDSISDFFEKYIQDDYIEKMMDSFGIPKNEERNKSTFCLALSLQLKLFIKSNSEDVECIVANEYKKCIINTEKSKCGPIHSFYSGDDIWIEKSPLKYDLHCYQNIKHTWVIHNQGTVIWKNRTLVLKNKDELSPRFSITQINIPETMPYGITKITTDIDARGSEGKYNSIWEMQDEKGNNCFQNSKLLFGIEINVTFNANVTEEINV